MDASQSIDLGSLIISEIQSKECLKSFKCGVSEIDHWANNKSFKYNERDRTRVFCGKFRGSASSVGFYSLSFTPVAHRFLPSEHRDIYKKDGAPFIYIDWLAVHRLAQCNGIGTMLLMDAILRSYRVSKDVAVYGICLRSLNERTTEKYSRHGFYRCDQSSDLMILPIWTVRDLVAGGSPPGA